VVYDGMQAGYTVVPALPNDCKHAGNDGHEVKISVLCSRRGARDPTKGKDGRDEDGDGGARKGV
jgi:hypothetical protein